MCVEQQAKIMRTWTFTWVKDCRTITWDIHMGNWQVDLLHVWCITLDSERIKWLMDLASAWIQLHAHIHL